MKNGKKFDWQAYDDRMSQQPGRGTIVITRPRDEDLGQYQCFAENEHGIATSNSVFVRKAELNTFKDEQPKTVTANEGDPFKLQCQPPDGWPKPKVSTFCSIGTKRKGNRTKHFECGRSTQFAHFSFLFYYNIFLNLQTSA